MTPASPPNTTPPVATLNAPPVNIANAPCPYEFTVNYADSVDAVRVSTLGNNDVVVTGPNGYSQAATFVTVDQATDGTPRMATYEITPAGGSWTAADVGTYTVTMQANQVSDVDGNFVVAGSLGTFVASPGNGDTTPPVAALNASGVTSGGASTYSFTVTYTDPDDGVLVSTLDSSDVRVTGPNGFSRLATFASVDNNTNGTPRTATYKFTPPGGTWVTADNGTYTVTMLANQVSDQHSNYVAAGTLGTFVVNVTNSTPPVATLYAPNINNAGATFYDFAVTYTDASGVNVSSFSGTNILVTGPNGFSQMAAYVGVDNATNGTPRTATYQITPADGAWDAADNGTYTVTMEIRQVGDISGNYVPSGPLGTFSVSAGDSAPPTAALGAPNVLASCVCPIYTFTVTYSDNTAVSVATLSGSNLVVTGPNGYSEPASFAGVDDDTDGTPRTATYQVPAPNGAWQLADNGTYTVSMQAGQVGDVNGNFMPAGSIGTFQAAIPDTSTPVASLFAPNLTVIAGTTYSFSVTYSDPIAPISFKTLSSKNIAVTGPNGYNQTAKFAGAGGTADGSPLTAMYQITPPDGSWSMADAGAYTISMRASQVSDAYGVYVAPGPLGTFNVGDLTPPVATLAVSDVSAGGATSCSFTVTYTDPDDAVALATLTSSNVTVTGPNGFSQPAAFVDANSAGDKSPLTATYQFTPPGGAWSAADDGAYTVSMQLDQVSDTHGNYVAAGPLGSFNVNIPDQTPPVPALSAPDLTAGGGSTYAFTITYTDPDDSVSRATLSGNNVTVTGPNGFSQPAALVGASGATDSSPLTATYQVAAPGGVWAATANGTYTVAMQANQVSDTHGNFIDAGPIGQFSVRIDTAAPTPSLAASNVNTAGGTSYQLTVTYTDDFAVSVATLGNNNLLVTGPNGFSQGATLVGVDHTTDGTPRIATYQITPPGGSWDPTGSGTYTVSLQANQVSDTSGNFISAGPIGTFDVDVGPKLSIQGVTLPDGTSGTTKFNFAVTLSAASTAPVTVRYATQDGTAVAGSDYLAASGTLTFQPGKTQQTVTVLVKGTKLYQSEKTFSVNLSGPGGASIAQAAGTGTILNRNAPPAISIGNVSIKEGNSGTTNFNFVVSLSAASGCAATVQYAAVDGTATTADNDYRATGGTLTFAPGQTKQTVTVAVNGDTKYEANETFSVNLSNPGFATVAKGKGTGLGSLVNDDAPPVLTIGDATVIESAGGGSAVFTVTLSPVSGLAATVKYAAAAGTAKAGRDFSATSGILTFAPGQTTQTIAVPILSDPSLTSPETFLVKLSAPKQATLGSKSAGTGTIDPKALSAYLGALAAYQQPAVRPMGPAVDAAIRLMLLP